jgi:hypothetical protein
MVQELLPFLPPALTTEQAAICVALLLLGVFLWTAGAVWSRGILSLIAVASGGLLGMTLPRWGNWPLNDNAAAVLGAVILGVLAFTLSRLFVGLLLGIVMSGWVALAAWMTLRGGANWPWRDAWEVSNMTLPQHLVDMWSRLPDPVRKPLPYGAGTAMVSALGLCLLFPRLGRVVCFSVTGMTVLFLAALTLTASRRPDWIAQIPPAVDIQTGVLGVLVLIGMLLQWQFLPHKRDIVDAREEQEQIHAAANQAPMPSTGPHKFA